MKKLFIALSVFALTLSACGTQTTEGEQQEGTTDGTTTTATETPRKTGKKVKSESDSISYAMGVDVGTYFKQRAEMMGEDFNLKMVNAAIKDVFAEKPTLTIEDASKFMQEYLMVRIPARKKAEGEAFLAKIAEENANIQKTESGLMYEIIEPGNEIKAVNPQDRVRVLYTGKMKDGKDFDSTTKEDGTIDTAEFALQGVIRGWTEGLKLIGEGGKLKLWIPAELAYGQYGRGPIGPNEPLLFDMEVIEVIPAPVAEETQPTK